MTNYHNLSVDTKDTDSPDPYCKQHLPPHVEFLISVVCLTPVFISPSLSLS